MSIPSLITMNDNVLAALDVETTGRDPCRHEVIQIAIVLADCNLNPTKHFYSNICPQYPDRIHPEAVATHGLTYEALKGEPDRYTVADSLWDWYQSLNLAPGKRLIPLCHNSQFDIPFVQSMLGMDMFYEIFGYPTRDTQATIVSMMDAAAFHNSSCDFKYAKLGEACKVLGVQLEDAHDALADALATLRVYKALMEKSTW
jgi:DNA polymerase III epsilon subunit-like protein